MKHLSSLFTRGSIRLFSALLALLGFSGCDRFMAAMYGSPNADYAIKGKVTDTGNRAIPNIEVKCLTRLSGDGKIWYDTISGVKTDREGQFDLSFNYLPTDGIRLLISDIDGEKNGSFATDSIDIPIKAEEYKKGDKSWYHGKVEKTVSVRLKEQKTGKE